VLQVLHQFLFLSRNISYEYLRDLNMNMLKILLLLALYSTLEVTHAENATACEICGKPLPDEEASFIVSYCAPSLL
jgi:hypothetical protein